MSRDRVGGWGVPRSRVQEEGLNHPRALYIRVQ